MYCSGSLPSNNAERQIFAINLANTYSGTSLESDPQAQSFIFALKNNDTATLVNLGGAILASTT